MSRLQPAFVDLHGSGRPGLVTYITAGDPDGRRTAEVVLGVARGGADIIEIGVPFSDPIADGPSIQRAIDRALAGGGSLAATLDLIGRLRGEISVPLVLFTYVNPVLRMGLGPFSSRAAAAGVDAVLLVDLPIEESREIHAALSGHGLDQVFLISPTTSDERLAEAAALGQGFLYAISRLGVTGARATVAASAAPLVERIRRATTLPVALGFGIARPEHVREVCAVADAAVVGSALVDVIADAAARGQDVGRAAEAFVRWLKDG